MTPRGTRRKGISEVIGALLLILVAVSAVASLAYFVSSAQTQAQNRSALLTNLQDDNLKVVYAAFSPNDPTIQWELDACPASNFGLSGTNSNWYVQQVVASPRQVTLIPQTSGAGLTNVQAVFASGTFYNGIVKGEAGNPSGSSQPYTLTFAPGAGSCVFGPATWNSITLTVRNENTQASSLQGVQIDGGWRSVWFQVDQSGTILTTLGVTQAPLPIPPRASVNIRLDRSTFGSSPLPKNASASVSILSGVGNYFAVPFSTPTAIPRFSISAQASQGPTRDVVTLDGSQSYAVSGSVQSYQWKIDIPNAAYALANGCTSAGLAAFSTTTNYDTAYASGQTVQYAPESLFSSHLGDCLIGPVRATLMVTDANGMIAVSQPIVISPDGNIDPVGSISAAKSGCTSTSCTVTVTVDDIFGNTVKGAVVDAVRTFGDSTSTALSQTTGPLGTATFTVNFVSGGSINFETGALLPAQVSFP